jgi:hypothetical protein
MSKVQIIGDRIEFNGFLVGRVPSSVARSVKADFETYLNSTDQRTYDRGYAAGVEAEKHFQMDDHR